MSLPALSDDVRERAREGAPDFYVAALLAPANVREDLIALAAFAGEIDRIPFLVADPKLGEIRLQWWIDVVEQKSAGASSGHPVADAVRELISKRGFSAHDFAAYVEGTHYLFGTDEPTEAELENYFLATAGHLFSLWQRLLGLSPSGEWEALVRAGASAYGRATLARNLVRLLGKGRCPLPLSYFGGRDPRQAPEDEARGCIEAALAQLAGEAGRALAELRAQNSTPARPMLRAMLPVALVAPLFRALRAPNRDVLRTPADISPLSRVMRLGLARWLGRV